MSDTPKFEVIDRRKFKAAEEEQEAGKSSHPPAAPPAEPEVSSGGPRLVVNDHKPAPQHSPEHGTAESQLEAFPGGLEGLEEAAPEMPPMPTAQESRELKTAYEGAALRLEDLIRAQNPAMGPQPPVTFEHLVQQFYVSAMIQMGAGAQEGQRPRVDIVGARTTIDLLGVLDEKTQGKLNETENRALQTVLFEVRQAFLELTSMISLQAMQPPQPPPPGKR